jgi:hypothetical protein
VRDVELVERAPRALVETERARVERLVEVS